MERWYSRGPSGLLWDRADRQSSRRMRFRSGEVVQQENGDVGARREAVTVGDHGHCVS
jgi:hypothetical protein